MKIKKIKITDVAIIADLVEAEANRVISASITPELIQMKEAEARMEHGRVSVPGCRFSDFGF